MKKAETLAEIRQATELAPLEGKALETFYEPADRGRDPFLPASSVLHNYLYETPDPIRLLFASHLGAGKSTELNRLMRKAAQDFWFIHFSVRKELDIATLTHVDLILALMEELYQAGRREHLIRDERVIEPVRGWLSEVVRETKMVQDEALEMGAGVGIDGLLSQIIGLSARLRSAFSLGHQSAETVRQVLRPRVPQLRQYCNQVLVEISSHLDENRPKPSRRRLFVIVDDTDKLDLPQAHDLFVEHTGLLADLNVSILYTAPIHLIYGVERGRLQTYFEIQTLPVIKTHTPQGERFEEGRQVLRQIVARRLNVKKLMEPDALTMAIEKTGGVLRDLLKAIRQASEVARYASTDRISAEAMRYSLDKLKSEYHKSIQGREDVTTDALYEKMKEVARAHGRAVPQDKALQLLLYTQAVIEYNGLGWYDLHPLVRENLREMGFLDELAR